MMRHRLLRARFHLFMRHLAASRRPIVVGPHHRELGFEALYWLPFVQQLRADYGLDKGRLIALSRGGMGAAYDMAATTDIYDYLPVETVRLHAVRATQAAGVLEAVCRRAVGAARRRAGRVVAGPGQAADAASVVDVPVAHAGVDRPHAR